MNKRKKTILALALATVLALAVAVPAFAANDGATVGKPAATDETCVGEGYGGRMSNDGMRGLGGGGLMSTAMAELLGMEPAELEAARQDGQSLADVAASKGLTLDELISGMLDAHKAALADAVADGRITQEQADLMLQSMSDRILDRIDDTEVGPPADRRGHGRGGQGGQGGQGGYGTCLGDAQ